MIGADGKPKTAPRGVFSGPGRSGKVESSYFAKTAYVTIGKLLKKIEFIIEKGTSMLIQQVEIDNTITKRRKRFVMNRNSSLLVELNQSTHYIFLALFNLFSFSPCKALWGHKPEFHEVKKNYRGPDGKVVIPNRNIITNNPKSGHGDSTIGHLLSKGYKHMADPYNRPIELQKVR